MIDEILTKYFIFDFDIIKDRYYISIYNRKRQRECIELIEISKEEYKELKNKLDNHWELGDDEE